MDIKQIYLVLFAVLFFATLYVFFEFYMSKKSQKSKKTIRENMDEAIESIKGLPPNHIKSILTRQYLEKMVWMSNQNPRYYRGFTGPAHLDDLGLYCKINHLKPIYPDDWKGIRIG
jgi:hypothetical protein